MVASLTSELSSRKKGEKSKRKEKLTLQKSYSIGVESGGLADMNNTSLSALPIAPRPAVIAQGNWKFVEQLLQVRFINFWIGVFPHSVAFDLD